jgi:hypothetical protein
MKQGRTLPSLAQELARQADAKRDFIAEAGAVRVTSNGHTDLILKESFAVNEVAHGQLAEYAGIPKGFYDRLRGATDLRVPAVFREDEGHEAPSGWDDAPLFDVMVNRLLKSKGDDRRMVRTLDGKARAFLSDSYNPDLDNFDVFRVAAKALDEAGLCPDDVVSCDVTERRLYLKVVSPKMEAVIEPSNLAHAHGSQHMLKEPQVVQAGFILTNSETGLGSLSVQQVVYKLMCTNLWVLEEGYRQRHLGKALQSDDDGRLYRSDTRKAEATARLLKIRDHVSNALDETRFRALVGRMQETTEVKLEGSVEKIMEVTARKIGLSIAEKDETLRHLIEGGDLSLWGLTNAVTATAQNAVSYDRATELEAAGGRFFALPAAEVKEIARAA